MADVKPFRAFRPTPELGAKIASKPYDVLSSEEARDEAEGNPYSFYHINKAEIDFPPGTDEHSDAVYQKARENLIHFISEGWLRQDENPCYYIYAQRWKGKAQFGIVGGSSIDDYFNDVIKKHEFTRPAKEEDRIRHMYTISAHEGPVFLTYPDVSDINRMVEQWIQDHQPEYDFDAGDEVRHQVWVIDNREINDRLEYLFKEEVPATYIADGHHRAASSAKVGTRLREENPEARKDAPYNYFLSVLFPASQLTIIDYNRVVKDLNGLSKAAFLEKVSENFEVFEMGTDQARPSHLREYGMYLDGMWYKIVAKHGTYNNDDPVEALDITVLSKNLLDPVLGIKDQRTDDRIDFVGGIRGLGELEKRVKNGEAEVAFAIHPVTIEQLMTIADSDEVMPPKTTWFEPKLRSGLLINKW